MELSASPWTDIVIDGKPTVNQAESTHSATIKDDEEVTVSASVTHNPKENAVTQEKLLLLQSATER